MKKAPNKTPVDAAGTSTSRSGRWVTKWGVGSTSSCVVSGFPRHGHLDAFVTQQLKVFTVTLLITGFTSVDAKSARLQTESTARCMTRDENKRGRSSNGRALGSYPSGCRLTILPSSPFRSIVYWQDIRLQIGERGFDSFWAGYSLSPGWNVKDRQKAQYLVGGMSKTKRSGPVNQRVFAVTCSWQI